MPIRHKNKTTGTFSAASVTPTLPSSPALTSEDTLWVFVSIKTSTAITVTTATTGWTKEGQVQDSTNATCTALFSAAWNAAAPVISWGTSGRGVWSCCGISGVLTTAGARAVGLLSYSGTTGTTHTDAAATNGAGLGYRGAMRLTVETSAVPGTTYTADWRMFKETDQNSGGTTTAHCRQFVAYGYDLAEGVTGSRSHDAGSGAYSGLTVFLVPATPSAFGLCQSARNQGISTTTFNLSFPQAARSGSSLIVALNNRMSGTSEITSVSYNSGLGFTRDFVQVSGSDEIQIWRYANNQTTTNPLITVQRGAGSGNLSIIAFEFVGIATTNPVDRTGFSGGMGTAASATTSAALGSGNRLAIGLLANAATVASVSVASPYASRGSYPDATTAALTVGTRDLVGGAAETVGFTLSATATWIGGIVTYKEAAAGATAVIRQPTVGVSVTPGVGVGVSIRRASTIASPNTSGLGDRSAYPRSSTVAIPATAGPAPIRSTGRGALISGNASLGVNSIDSVARGAFIGPAVGVGVEPTIQMMSSTANLGSLVDTFSDTVASPMWTVHKTATPTLTETGAVLQISLSSAGAGSDYGYYTSASAYRLTGQAIHVEVLPLVATTNVRVLLRVQATAVVNPSADAVWIQYNGNTQALEWQQTGIGAITISYQEAAHRWWRIRETAGVLYGDVSADGLTWSHPDALPDGTTAWKSTSILTGAELESVYVQFGARTSSAGAAAAAYTASFDNLNAPPAAGNAITRAATTSIALETSAGRRIGQPRGVDHIIPVNGLLVRRIGAHLAGSWVGPALAALSLRGQATKQLSVLLPGSRGIWRTIAARRQAVTTLANSAALPIGRRALQRAGGVNLPASGALTRRDSSSQGFFGPLDQAALSAWKLYTEAFWTHGALTTFNPNDGSPGYTMTQTHRIVADASAPSGDGQIYQIEITTSGGVNTGSEPVYVNVYRYQDLPWVDAVRWIYRINWRYAGTVNAPQAVEFPFSVYQQGRRLEAAFTYIITAPTRHWRPFGATRGWDANRPSTEQAYGFTQELDPDVWHRLEFVVDIANDQITYRWLLSDGVLFVLNESYPGVVDMWNSPRIVAALQIDNVPAGTQQIFDVDDYHLDYTTVAAGQVVTRSVAIATEIGVPLAKGGHALKVPAVPVPITMTTSRMTHGLRGIGSTQAANSGLGYRTMTQRQIAAGTGSTLALGGQQTIRRGIMAIAAAAAGLTQRREALRGVLLDLPGIGLLRTAQALTRLRSQVMPIGTGIAAGTAASRQTATANLPAIGLAAHQAVRRVPGWGTGVMSVGTRILAQRRTAPIAIVTTTIGDRVTTMIQWVAEAIAPVATTGGRQILARAPSVSQGIDPASATRRGFGRAAPWGALAVAWLRGDQRLIRAVSDSLAAVPLVSPGGQSARHAGFVIPGSTFAERWSRRDRSGTVDAEAEAVIGSQASTVRGLGVPLETGLQLARQALVRQGVSAGVVGEAHVLRRGGATRFGEVDHATTITGARAQESHRPGGWHGPVQGTVDRISARGHTIAISVLDLMTAQVRRDSQRQLTSTAAGTGSLHAKSTVARSLVSAAPSIIAAGTRRAGYRSVTAGIALDVGPGATAHRQRALLVVLSVEASLRAGQVLSRSIGHAVLSFAVVAGDLQGAIPTLALPIRAVVRDLRMRAAVVSHRCRSMVLPSRTRAQVRR